MPLEQYDKPARPAPPQRRALVAIVATGALFTAVLILTMLRTVPLPLRVLLAAGELLTSALVCWAIVKSAKR